MEFEAHNLFGFAVLVYARFTVFVVGRFVMLKAHVRSLKGFVEALAP